MSAPLYSYEEGKFRKGLGLLVIMAGIILGIITGSIGFLFAIGLIFLGIHLWKSGKRLLKGFEGERAVIQIFKNSKKLNGVLLSDIVSSHVKSNINHVFICSQGIFAIEVKNYSFNIIVN